MKIILCILFYIFKCIVAYTWGYKLVYIIRCSLKKAYIIRQKDTCHCTPVIAACIHFGDSTFIIDNKEMLKNVLRALVLELFLEIFYGKMIMIKQLILLTTFYIFYESNIKTFLI